MNTNFRITPKVALGSIDVPTYCVRFEQNDRYVAAAKGDGSIQIFNMQSGKLSYILNQNMENP